MRASEVALWMLATERTSVAPRGRMLGLHNAQVGKREICIMTEAIDRNSAGDICSIQK